MKQEPYKRVLMQWYAGLIDHSDLMPQYVDEAALQLSQLVDRDARSIRDVLRQSTVSQWRLACGTHLWHCHETASDFLRQHNADSADLAEALVIDAWLDDQAFVPNRLIEEILRVD